MAAVTLLALVAGCSDDDKPNPDLYVPPDAGVDAPAMEAGPDGTVADAGPEATPGDVGVDTAPDTGPKYSVLVGMAEYTMPGSGDAGPTTLLRPLASVDRPDPTVKPDFIDSPTPPNCYAYKYSATTPKNATAYNAGKLTITGHNTALYVDGDNPAAPTALPASIECTRQLVTGSTTLYEYNCGLPLKTVLPVSSALEATTKLDISAAGGADVPAFSETNVGIAGAPTVTTDLNALDPTAGITINWTVGSANPPATLVAVVVRAYLADYSEIAEISCSGIAMMGSKQIPAGALALIPTPTATNPLIMQTFVAGLNVGGATETWGDYKVGGGKGTFGVTCRSPAGVFPCP